MKYADDSVLLSKRAAALQGTTDRLNEAERCYGMEMNVEKTTVMRISIFPAQIMTEKNDWRVWNI